VLHEIVTHAPRLAETSEVGDLQADHFRSAVANDPCRHSHAIDTLVEFHRQIRAGAHVQALFIGEARLFDHNAGIANLADDPHRIFQRPAAVGIRERALTGFQQRGGLVDPVDIGLPVRADLDLELAIAGGPVRLHLTARLVPPLLRYDPVHRAAVGQFSSEQDMYRKPRTLAEDVPTGGIEGRLGIAVPADRRVH